MKIIQASIDVSKIDKSRLVNGKKGTYLNLEIHLKDEKDQYGNNVSIAEGQTKEERESKTKKNYLGNGRVVWEGSSNKPENKQENQNQNDGLPF